MMNDIEKCTLQVKLTEAEINAHARELARVSQELDRTKGQKKEVTAQYAATEKALESQIYQKSILINQGYEMRLVECRWIYDWETGTKALYRTDTGELVRNDRISMEDRQGWLEFNEKQKADAEKAEEQPAQINEGIPALPEGILPMPAGEVVDAEFTDAVPALSSGDVIDAEFTEGTVASGMEDASQNMMDCAPETNDAGDCKNVWGCRVAKRDNIGCCKVCDDFINSECVEACEKAKDEIPM